MPTLTSNWSIWVSLAMHRESMAQVTAMFAKAQRTTWLQRCTSVKNINPLKPIFSPLAFYFSFCTRVLLHSKWLARGIKFTSTLSRTDSIFSGSVMSLGQTVLPSAPSSKPWCPRCLIKTHGIAWVWPISCSTPSSKPILLLRWPKMNSSSKWRRRDP